MALAVTPSSWAFCANKRAAIFWTYKLLFCLSAGIIIPLINRAFMEVTTKEDIPWKAEKSQNSPRNPSCFLET
jgi:hypothetical protein